MQFAKQAQNKLAVGLALSRADAHEITSRVT